MKKERIEKEKQRMEKERIEKERIEKERREKERRENERKENERKEKERLENERKENERKEKERLENERKEKERLEKERKEKERIEKERIEKESEEKERLTDEKMEELRFRTARKDKNLISKEKLKNKYSEAKTIKEILTKDNLSKEASNINTDHTNYKYKYLTNRNKKILLPNYTEEKIGGANIIKVKKSIFSSNSSENIKKEFPKENKKEINIENEDREKTSYKSLRFSSNKSKLTESSSAAYFNRQKNKEEERQKKLFWSNMHSPNEQKSDLKEEESLIKNKLIIERMKNKKLKLGEMKEQKSEPIFKKHFLKEEKEKDEIKKDLFNKEDIQKNTIKEEYIFEIPKKSILDQDKEMKSPKEKYKLKLSKRNQEENIKLKSQLSGEIEPKKKDKFRIFKKDDINKITLKHKKNKQIFQKSDNESQQTEKDKDKDKEKSEEELSSKYYQKKKESKEFYKDNESEIESKKLNKNNLNVQTDEDLVENLKQKLTESIFNSSNKKLKIKGYKDKMLNLSEERDEYANKEQNLDNLTISKNGLGSKIKIFRCVVWKNTNPDMNEDILKTIMHYRNRSQGGNKSFIMKFPKGLNLKENFSTNNLLEQIKTEENNIENESNNDNKISKFRLKKNKSYASLYKRSYYKK